MLTPRDFLTVAGAAAITKALVFLLKAIWKKDLDPWATWTLAEVTVFVGGLLKGPLTPREGLLLFVSGMVVAAVALGSQSAARKALP